MTSELSKVIEAYADLERLVRDAISSLYGEVCALCTSSCCTPDICEESLDSAFLRALRESCESKPLFCDRYGWLTERGCGLQIGRPPVCYSFFCDEIRNALDDRERIIIAVLGRSLAWVGERAVGPVHLVEITDDASLSDVNVGRVLKRISIAHDALKGVREVLCNEPVSSSESRLAMQRILRSVELDA